jgi:cytochrome b
MTATADASDRRVAVWDLPTRLFHWALLALVVLCWFTGEEEELRTIHRIAGESIAGLIVFRLIWGFVGGEHARFANFAAGPGAVIAHVRDLFSGAPKRHLGHNPLGGVAVFLLLATTAVVVVTGLFSSHDDFAGPFAGLWGLQLSEVHEVSFRVLQGLVVVHVLGVVMETLLARDALVPAMITGAKRRRADEAGEPAKRVGFAALLAALVFGAAVSAALIVAPPGVSGGEHAGGGEHEDDEHD